MQKKLTSGIFLRIFHVQLLFDSFDVFEDIVQIELHGVQNSHIGLEVSEAVIVIKARRILVVLAQMFVS